MTKRTRYFMFGAMGLLILGLTVGLAAYYGGIRGIARQAGPGELALVPSDASVVAYANVRDLMASQFRQEMKNLGATEQQQGQNELRNAVGIDVEKDIDYVVACLVGAHGTATSDRNGCVLAHGTFDRPRIEAFVRSKGGVDEHYKGRTLLVRVADADRHPSRDAQPLAMTFVEPGVVALGTVAALHEVIDVATGAAPAVASNREMMKMIAGAETGNNAWVVGRFDALSSEAHIPAEVQRQLPQLTWFSASGHVNGGVSGAFSVQARDQEAATNLQQVVAGFIALAKMQAGSRPELNALLQSVTLSGNASDNTVSVSFTIPAAAIEALKAAAGKERREK